MSSCIHLGKSVTVRDHRLDEVEADSLTWVLHNLQVTDSIPGGTPSIVPVWTCRSSDRVYLRPHETKPTHVKAELEWLFGMPPGEYKVDKCISLPMQDVLFMHSVTSSTC
jgi:hypothetical protein